MSPETLTRPLISRGLMLGISINIIVQITQTRSMLGTWHLIIMVRILGHLSQLNSVGVFTKRGVI